jgi:hypothetical protein
MRLFAIGLEFPHYVAVQRPHYSDPRQHSVAATERGCQSHLRERFRDRLGSAGNLCRPLSAKLGIPSKEESMRILPIAVVLALLGPAAVAQTNAPAPQGYLGAYGPDNPNRPVGGPLPDVYPGPGRDEVGSDGISTKVVKAAPCSTTARETDGTTTCIGIPGRVPRDYTTTGTSSGR